MNFKFRNFARLLAAMVAVVGAAGAYAQRPAAGEAAPVDSSVRVGVLPNGITYYLKHNDKPTRRANFHIYYKVGAIQETDTQNGLAHFLEHMAFNGSQHFPGNSMIDWLSGIGVRFGENLNAATGQEQTTYMITDVPLTRDGIIDSALLILHDWAGRITLDTADIDKERGVITEEWRQGNSAGRRVFERQSPVLFNGSLYARRNVIGNQEVIQGFAYDELRDFYRKWYRPDLQAFFIVGDFDVDSMEQRLKRTMADLPAAAVRTPKATVTVEDNELPLVSVVSDPELTGTSVELLFRDEPLRDRYDGMERLWNQYVRSLAARMLSIRFVDLARQEGAPFRSAGCNYSPVVRPFDAFFVAGSARDGEALRTLEALYTELCRVRANGFVASELDRVKLETMRQTESYFENRNDRKNGEFVSEYMRHFESGEPYLTPEQDLAITRRILDAISLEDVNRVAAEWVRDRNSAVLISMREDEKHPLPTEAEVREVIDRVKNIAFDAYEEVAAANELMDASALPGAPVVKTTAGRFGSTVWTLKNGVRVVVKPTQLKADEVQMTAFQRGGTTTVEEVTDLYNLGMLPSYLGTTGVGNFSRTELDRYLAGRRAGAMPSVGSLSQGFGGSCSPRDVETMLQLVYLYCTAPRFERSDWNVMMDRYRSMLPGVTQNPNYILQDSLFQTVYGHNPRTFMLMSVKVLDTVSLERTEQLYRHFFSNADGMTFVFVGNIAADSLRPLAEKYLGSLPAKRGKAPRWGRHVVVPVPGVVQNMYKTPLESPKVTAVELYSGALPYTLARSIELEAIRYMLEMRYTRKIREERGGTYGVGVSLTYQKEPLPRFAYQIFFETDTAKIGELLPLVGEEIRALVTEGVTADELTRTKEFFLKRHRDGLIHNGTWLGYLTSWYLNDNDRYDGYEAAVQALTSESVRAAAAAAFGQGNVCTVVQLPEEPREE